MRYGIIPCPICFGFGLQLPLSTRLEMLKLMSENKQMPTRLSLEGERIRCNVCYGTGWIFSSEAKMGLEKGTIKRWINR